jgi:predicted Zn-dependent protease
MANFFNTLERKSRATEEGELPDFLSTHPNPGDRNTAVNKLATEWNQKLGNTNPAVNRDSYLKMLEGMIYGEDPKQGFVENSVFYHPVLKFNFQIPRDWIHHNSPQTFQMAPKNGKAMMMLTLAPGSSLQEAANGVLQANSLTLIESRQVTVNGLQAISMVSEQRQQAQQGQQAQATVRALSYLIQFGGNIYHLLGVSAVNDFNSYYPLFMNSMQSFAELRDASKINKQPERVRIRTVRSNGSLDQALRANNVPTARMEETAVLNGMQLRDNVPSGTLIKVIGQ